MLNRLKIFLLLLILAVNGLLTARVFMTGSPADFTASDNTLVNIRHHYKTTNPKELRAERDSKIQLAAEVFSDYSNFRSAHFVIDAEMQQYADSNIIFSDSRQQFLSSYSQIEKSDLSDNSAISILSDRNYQQFAEIYPGINYSIYLEFQNNRGDSKQVVVNNRILKAEKIKNLFKIENFNIGAYDSVGIKSLSPDDQVEHAVFVAGKIIKVSKLSRAKSGEAKIERKGNLLTADFPRQQFLILDSNKAVDLLKRPRDPMTGTIAIKAFRYEESNKFKHMVDLAGGRINLIESPGDYLIQDPERFSLQSRIYWMLFFSAILIYLVYSRKAFSSIRKTATAYSQELRLKLLDSRKQIIFYGLIAYGIVLLLLVLNLNQHFTELINPTVIFAVIVAYLLVVTRFSKTLILALLFSIFISGVLAYFNGYHFLADKLVKIVYLLVLTLLFTESVKAILIQRKWLTKN